MHRWLLSRVMRHGQARVIVVATAISCLVSLVLVLLMCFTMFGSAFLDPDSRYLYWLAVLVPLIVTPPMMWFTVSALSAMGTLGEEYEALAHRHRELAEKDVLTGLLNTRGLLARHEYFEEGTVVALVDIDEFKAVNDLHGHHGGDLALVALAEELTTLAGDRGVVARTGGDEFIIVLTPGAGQELPGRVAVRVSDAIRVTATIGVYECPEDRPVAMALREADLRMYAGKKAANRDRLSF